MLVQWKNQALLLDSATADRLERNAFSKLDATADFFFWHLDSWALQVLFLDLQEGKTILFV